MLDEPHLTYPTAAEPHNAHGHQGQRRCPADLTTTVRRLPTSYPARPGLVLSEFELTVLALAMRFLDPGRVSPARAVPYMSPAPCLLLDEPTAHLEGDSAEGLLVTHSPELLDARWHVRLLS